MKVRCIDNLDGGLNLSIGKEYEVYKSTLDEHTTYYQLKNDFGTTQYYPQRHFEVVNEKDNKQQIKLQCNECACKPVCSEVDNWANYCKEHIALRKKSVLFDVEPSCRYYIDKKVLEKKKELNRPIVFTTPADNVFEKYLKWNFEDKELNHVAEDSSARIKKLNEKEFINLFEQLLNMSNTDKR